MRIVTEVLVDFIPFLVFVAAHLLEVGKEIATHPLMVEEIELLINERRHSEAAYGFCFLQHLTIELSLHLIVWLSEDVDAKVFPASHLHGFGNSYSWIEIQIEGKTTIGYWSAQQ